MILDVITMSNSVGIIIFCLHSLIRNSLQLETLKSNCNTLSESKCSCPDTQNIENPVYDDLREYDIQTENIYESLD